MLAGTSNRRVAALHGVTEQSVRRHGDHHLRSALALARENNDAEREVSLLEQLRAVYGRVGAVLAEAERVGDGRLVISAAREVRSCLESLGKWTGELREQHELVHRAQAVDPEVAAQIRDVLVTLRNAAAERRRLGSIVDSPHVHEGDDALPRALPAGEDRR